MAVISSELSIPSSQKDSKSDSVVAMAESHSSAQGSCLRKAFKYSDNTCPNDIISSGICPIDLLLPRDLSWADSSSPVHISKLCLSPQKNENYQNMRWLQVLTITLIHTYQLFIQILLSSLIYAAYRSKSVYNQPHTVLYLASAEEAI